ncbi:MAG: hypothetical protein Q7S27_02280 [Nanoarchaeota archaeon]|nr:hypothetical protein [Nanoarchaeota archaeon]
MEHQRDRRAFLKNGVKGLVGLVAGSLLNGCDRTHNEYLGFESHPVDQVFRDHDGFRLIYSDGEDILRENKYLSTLLNSDNRLGVLLENMPDEVRKKFKYDAPQEQQNYEPYFHCPPSILIIKDLKEGERGFANTVRYSYVREGSDDFERAYTEVHLPRNQNISPGNEVFGGKLKIEAEIHEVK